MAIFAVDVGGVLADKQHAGQPMEGCKEVLQSLQARGWEVWIVSQCGRNRALKTREWLNENGFTIPKERQIYIGFDEHNKNRVLREIKATWFIDDCIKHIRPALSLPKLKCFHFSSESHRELWQYENYSQIHEWYQLL